MKLRKASVIVLVLVLAVVLGAAGAQAEPPIIVLWKAECPPPPFGVVEVQRLEHSQVAFCYVDYDLAGAK